MDKKCEICNYVARDISDFNRHSKTKKHLEKVNKKTKILNMNPNHSKLNPNESIEKEYECPFCNKFYSTSSNLTKHINICKIKKQLVDEYENKIKNMEKVISELNSKILEIEKENQQLKKSFYSPNLVLNESLNITNFECEFCQKMFHNASNLSRHIKSCKNKIKHDDDIKQLNIQLDTKDEIITLLKTELSYMKTLVNTSGNMINTSISAMSYVIKNYKEAPALKALEDYSILHADKSNTEFVESLIYEYNHNKLDSYIGDFIIKTYKKEDPSQQSIWNSDTSRLTYLIRETINNNNIDWKVDKKGINTKKFVIDPTLEYIDSRIREFIENFDISHSKLKMYEIEMKTGQLKSATEILLNIQDNVLGEAVLKYITPYFYLSKIDNSLESK